MFFYNFQAPFRGVQLLTETHLMSPVLTSSPPKINSLFHHWVLQMQEMRCWGQVGNLEGLESPGNIPFPSSCAPGSWVDVMGGSSLDTAPLLTPACSRAENAALCHNLTSPVSINSAKRGLKPQIAAMILENAKEREWNNSWAKCFVSFQRKGFHQENWGSSQLQTPHFTRLEFGFLH